MAHLVLVLLLCLGLVGVMLLGSSTSVLSALAAGNAPSGQRLRLLAGNFLIGYASADDFWTLSDASTYEGTAAAEFNILTPENQLKWGTIEPQQNTFNFAPGDQHVAFAQATGMAVHGHNLLWGASNPGWLTGRSWTAASLTAVMYNHIDNVVGHYRGKIKIWDVVNEPINTPSIWQNTIGSSYIDLALRRAHADDPSAILIINEYSDEQLGGAGDALYSMAQNLLANGSPLGGVGFQMHLDENGTNLSSYAANMARFAALGLNIYITEMDVRIPQSPSSADLSTQANIYQGVLDRCLQQPACKGLMMWGFTDKYSWIPSFFPGLGAALPFDANYAPKPAYFALQSRLVGGGSVPPTSTPLPTSTPIPPTSTPLPTHTPAATSTPQPPTVVPSGGAGSTAAFMAQDLDTAGTWKGKYGAQGYWLEADAQNQPSYAPTVFGGASTFTWTGSTGDPRALQKAGAASGRIAASWFSAGSFAVDMNMTDGQPHKLSVYGVDWDQRGRAETIDVVDVSNWAVLDRRGLSNFVDGAYLSWTVSGHVQLLVTRTAGDNAVLSGVFLDPASSTPSASTPTPKPTATTMAAATATPTNPPVTATGASASFVAQDVASAGTWKGKYGAKGYWLEADGRSQPSYAPAASTNGTGFTWTGSTSDPRALQKTASSTDRLAATWFSTSSFTVDVPVIDGQKHKFTLYAVDWDRNNRVEAIDVVDAKTGALLDRRSLSNFVGGAYLSWSVSGHVQLRVTRTGGTNAVVSGLFFD